MLVYLSMLCCVDIVIHVVLCWRVLIEKDCAGLCSGADGIRSDARLKCNCNLVACCICENYLVGGRPGSPRAAAAATSCCCC